jgi:hypothetical protein
MRPTKNIWLALPGFIFLGLSYMFAFSNTFNAWDTWAYIWPLVIFLMMGAIWWTMKWAGRGEMTRRKAAIIGHQFSRIAYGTVVIIAIISVVAG